MPPPPTQSPHRFLKPNHKRGASPQKKANKPTSNLRQEVNERVDEDLRPNPRKGATSSQFAHTPRFVASKPQAASQQPAKSTPAPSFRDSSRRREDVQEAEDNDDGDEMLLDDGERETVITTTEPEPTWHQTLTHSPKRRRIDPPEAARLTPNRRPPIPQDPASTRSTPRFKPPDTTNPAPPAPSTNTTTRPSFLRPPAPAQISPRSPLPEAFSPQRRGQKFLSGGLAATLQQWVLETGQAAGQSRRAQGYLGGEEFVLKVRVEAVGGVGMKLVRGWDGDGEGVRVLLPEGGKGEVERGVVVGVRAPVWGMRLLGEVWTVGVDWRVLG